MQLTLLTSTGRDKIFEDMSQTSGTPFVSGTKSNSTPKNITQKNHHCLVVINDYQVSAVGTKVILHDSFYLIHN